MESFKKITPTLISLIALLVSIVSFYFSSLKPTHISLSVGESMQVWHNNTHELNIDLPVIFHNSGSQSGVVRSMGIILKNPNSEDALFVKWLGFKKFEDRVDGKSSWIYEMARTPIAVPPGGEVSKMVNFYADSAATGWTPKPITYDLYLLAWNGDGETPAAIQKLTWSFKESDITDITRRLNDGNSEGTWILNSSYASGSRKLTTIEFNQLTSRK